MKDRQPTYPGRVTLTPVAGQENTFDMVMADQPTEQGTPPTKTNLLSDATAAKFFESPVGTETVDQVLAKLGNSVNPAKIAVLTYAGTGAYGSSNPTVITLPFAPKLLFISPFGGTTNLSTYGASGAHTWIIIPYDAVIAGKIATGNNLIWTASNNTAIVTLSSDNLTMSFYNATDPKYQLNESGYTYYVVLIGGAS